VDAIGDARSGSRVVLREVTAVEIAAGDDGVRVAQLLRQVHGSQIQVGAGVQPDREGDRPVDQPVEQIRAGGSVVAPVREDVIVAGAVTRGPGHAFGRTYRLFATGAAPYGSAAVATAAAACLPVP